MIILMKFLTRFWKRSSPLQRMSVDGIRREGIRLEQQEASLVREIEYLEEQKEVLFQKGVAGGSLRQKTQIARKIREFDGLVRDKDQQLALISRNLRVLNGLAQVKSRESTLERLGLNRVLNGMSMEDIQQFIEQATVEGNFQMDRFSRLLDTVENPSSGMLAEEDAETREILAAMEAATEASTVQTVPESQLDQLAGSSRASVQSTISGRV